MALKFSAKIVNLAFMSSFTRTLSYKVLLLPHFAENRKMFLPKNAENRKILHYRYLIPPTKNPSLWGKRRGKTI